MLTQAMRTLWLALGLAGSARGFVSPLSGRTPTASLPRPAALPIPLARNVRWVPIGATFLDDSDSHRETSTPSKSQTVSVERIRGNSGNKITLVPPASSAYKKYLPAVALILCALLNRISSSPASSDAAIFSAVSAATLRSPFKEDNKASTFRIPAAAVLLPQLAWATWHARAAIVQSASQFAGWYMVQLDAMPLITKAITSGVISFAGDSMAQALERTLAARSDKKARPYDRRRAASTVCDGLFVTGPLLHFAYEWLDKLVPASAFSSASVHCMAQVLVDDIFLDSIMVGIIFLTTGLAEGYRPRAILKQMRKDYVPTVKTSWVTSAFLIPLEFACFRFLPRSLRCLGMNFIDVIWDGMISYMTHRNRKNQVQTTQSDLEASVNAQGALAMTH